MSRTRFLPAKRLLIPSHPALANPSCFFGVGQQLAQETATARLHKTAARRARLRDPTGYHLGYFMESQAGQEKCWSTRMSWIWYAFKEKIPRPSKHLGDISPLAIGIFIAIGWPGLGLRHGVLRVGRRLREAFWEAMEAGNPRASIRGSSYHVNWMSLKSGTFL
jgi:hypothetical protein